MAAPVNLDAARQCVDAAKQAMLKSDWELAIKRFERSQRLAERSLAGVDTLLAQCRQRLAAQRAPEPQAEEQPAAAPRKRATAPRPATSPTSADYTSEQLELVNRTLAAKTLWGVLGVEEGTSSGKVKHAFRKLAMRVHPDKNKAPRSKEAFQRVNHAFSILSNEESRVQYEQTGDSGEGGSSNDAQNGRAPRRQYYRRGGGMRQAAMDPDDLDDFLRAAFFGSGVRFQYGAGQTRARYYQQQGRQHRHQQHGGAGHHPGDEEEEEDEGLPGMHRLMQLLPLFVMLIVALGVLPQQLFPREPAFSFARGGTRSQQLFVTTPGLVKGTEYWVAPSRAGQLLSSRYARAEFEASVQQEKVSRLRRACAEEERLKSRLEWERQYALGARRRRLQERIDRFSDEHCDALREFSAQAQRARARARTSFPF